MIKFLYKHKYYKIYNIISGWRITYYLFIGNKTKAISILTENINW